MLLVKGGGYSGCSLCKSSKTSAENSGHLLLVSPENDFGSVHVI
jgi:RNA polymerase subunit RPABC4/transcription elongation factor Spt4